MNAQNATFTTATIQDLNASGTLNFGDGSTNGNITFNPGTGMISLSGATLQNVGDPVNPTDAVNRQFLENSFTTQTLTGDVTGTFGNTQLDPTSVGVGDRLIQGINAGTQTINNANVADDLTISGGTIDNTAIGATTASTGAFTSLTATDATLAGDLTVNGGATLGDGTGADDITINPGTGAVSFSGAVLMNVATPVAGTDAANKDYVDNSLTNQAFAGDITGTPGAITIDPANTGIGDRLIQGINAGTTTINDAAVADVLTVTGGTIDGTTIGATTPSTGAFTTLSSTGQTSLATNTGGVVIGTATPSATGAVLEVQRADAGDLGARIYNTGTGGADLRLIGGDDAMSSLIFGDTPEFLASVNADAATGMTFNVRDVVDPNTEAGLDASVDLTIERDGDVVVANDLTVNGTLNANMTTTGSALDVMSGGLAATAAPSGAISNRFADTYVVAGATTNTVTIQNSLVTPTSTVLVTFENNVGTVIPAYEVQTDATGSFTVNFNATEADAGDEIHYLIINH